MAPQTRSYSCPNSRVADVIDSTYNWLDRENFECQKLRTENGATLLQIQKKGGWRKLIGMSTALNIVFQPVENALNVEIGAGRWIDKAAAGTVSLFILWPLAVTAGIGAWQQANMPKRIYRHIDDYLKS